MTWIANFGSVLADDLPPLIVHATSRCGEQFVLGFDVVRERYAALGALLAADLAESAKVNAYIRPYVTALTMTAVMAGVQGPGAQQCDPGHDDTRCLVSTVVNALPD